MTIDDNEIPNDAPNETAAAFRDGDDDTGPPETITGPVLAPIPDPPPAVPKRAQPAYAPRDISVPQFSAPAPPPPVPSVAGMPGTPPPQPQPRIIRSIGELVAPPKPVVVDEPPKPAWQGAPIDQMREQDMVRELVMWSEQFLKMHEASVRQLAHAMPAGDVRHKFLATAVPRVRELAKALAVALAKLDAE